MKKNIMIALTVIVSLALLYWGIEFLKGINMFKPSNFYYATFDKVDGLAEAAPVPVMRVGVRDEFGRSGKVPALMKIYGLTADDIVEKAKAAISKKKQ